MALSEKVKTFSEFGFSQSVHFAERTHMKVFFLSSELSQRVSQFSKKNLPMTTHFLINNHIFFNYLFLVIGYGLTSTGFTVLAGILMATLGMTYVAGGARYKRRQRKRKFGIVDKRQEFIENCNINPHLKPACIRNVQNLQKRRKYIPRS